MILLSNVIKACQVRQEEKLRQLFAAKEEVREEITEPEAQEIPEVDPEEEIKAAQKEAAAIIAEANLEAERIAREVKDQVTEIKETSYQEGFQQGLEQGYQAGFAEITRELEKLITNLERELDRIQLLLNNQVLGLSPRLINFSCQLANTILKREIELHPEVIITQVEDILKGLSRVKTLAIRVNAGDIALVKSSEERFLQLTQGIDQIDFVVDPSLEPGGCIIETDFGGVDASIQTQLAMITTLLLEGNGKEDV